MSDHTLRVPDHTYQAIKELAGEEMTLQAVVVQAVETLRRQRFWADYHAAYATLKADPVAWADFQEELAAWEATLADGLEGEPPPAEV
jgi:hypothetical protein